MQILIFRQIVLVFLLQVIYCALYILGRNLHSAIIQGIVRSLTKDGIGILITAHNVRETLAITDRAYILFDGVVQMQVQPAQGSFDGRTVTSPSCSRARISGEEPTMWKSSRSRKYI